MTEVGLCDPCSRGYHYACQGCDEKCSSAVCVEDLIKVRDIARLYGIGPQAISNWARRDPDFPPPVPGLYGVYVLSAVQRWRAGRNAGQVSSAHEPTFAEIAQAKRDEDQ